MKYSAAVLSLAAVAAAKPAFTNLSFDLKQGEPFTLEFTGCDEGCTINLKNGPSDDLKTVEQLTNSATGTSFTFTPENLPTDTYAFEIIDAQGEDNYSVQFEYEGDASPVTSTMTTEAAASTTASSSSTPEETTSTTTTTEEATTMTTPATTETETKTTTASETATPTDESTTTESAAATSASVSTVPDDGNAATGLAARGSLVLAALAGSLLFL